MNNQYQEEYGIDAATYNELVYGVSTEEYVASVMTEVALDVKYDYILKQIAENENVSIEEAGKMILDSAIIEGLERQ